MKKIFLLIFLLITGTTTIKAQNTLQQFPEVDGKVVYESVVDVPGKNKDYLYFFTNKWLTNIPNGVRATVAAADKDLGQINADGIFKYGHIVPAINSPDDTYQFKIQIDVKDNKYRIRLYQITDKSTTALDTTIVLLEQINPDLKSSDAKPRHIKAAEVDSIFKGIISSLKDLIDKSANDNF